MPKYRITVETDKKEELAQIIGAERGESIARIYAELVQHAPMAQADAKLKTACELFLAGLTDEAKDVASGVVNMARARAESEVSAALRTAWKAIYDEARQLLKAIEADHTKAHSICCNMMPEYCT